MHAIVHVINFDTLKRKDSYSPLSSRYTKPYVNVQEFVSNYFYVFNNVLFDEIDAN